MKLNKPVNKISLAVQLSRKELAFQQQLTRKLHVSTNNSGTKLVGSYSFKGSVGITKDTTDCADMLAEFVGPEDGRHYVHCLSLAQFAE